MRTSAPLRFSFQTKVLAPVLLFLVLLPTITLWLINRQISGQALAEARQTLTTADAVFRNSLDILERGLITRFRGVVNEPRFKAVAQLGDARTMTDFLRSSLEEYGSETELVIYSTKPGVMLAGAHRQPHSDLTPFLKATADLSSDAFDGEASIGTVFAAGQAYSVVAVPVPSSDHLSVAGVLTIGLSFGQRTLEELKSLTRTDIVIFSDQRVITSTLARDLQGDWDQDLSVKANAPVQRVMPLEVEGEHFLAFAGSYAAATDRPGFRYLLLSSYEARLQALQTTQFMLAGISLLGILISGGSVWFLIRRITHPLRALRDSAEAVGRGDFTRHIEQFSNDECGEVAGAFNRMTGNLLTSRNELETTVDTLRSTEARLRTSEEQLRLTIESAHDHMICTLTSSGQIQRWNGAAERLLGHTAAQAQGLAYTSFFATKERESGVPGKLLATAAETGRAAFEGWRVRRDGSRFWADVTLSKLPDNAGFVEIARDNTPRKKEEEAILAARDAAEASNQAKTDFIANMSHELRTPMNAIIGMSSLLLGERLPEETRDCVTTINASADALLQIIDDILDISKIDAGRLELHPQPFDLCSCIEGVIDLFAARSIERSIEFAVHLDRDLPATITSDPARLTQVLSNILGNAVKFTERGGVTLSVSRDKADNGEDRLHFSIQDTGIGIPANRMDRLFKTFSQVDTSTTRRFGGTGLGLAIAKRLVDLMGGEIGVESEVGRGSRFFFFIVAPCEKARQVPEFSGLEDRRLRIVAPDTLTSNTLARQLTTWGAKVDCAPHFERTGNVETIFLADLATHPPFPTEKAPEIATIQLTRVGVNRPEATAGRLFLTTPWKPRALYNAVRKALNFRARSVEQAATPKLGSEFGQRHPLRILLVEDNPVNAQVAQLLLKRLGYAPDWAINGRKAVEKTESNTYDVVLMDLQMPEMDGLDATRIILQTLPETQLPYIIALTANARKEDREACAGAGMHDFMSKPVQLEKMAVGLERAFSWRSARVAACAPDLARPE